MYYNKAETTNEDIYDDFKLKTPLVSMVYIQYFISLMVNIRYRIKPEEVYVLSFEKGRGRKPRLFSKLRM